MINMDNTPHNLTDIQINGLELEKADLLKSLQWDIDCIQPRAMKSLLWEGDFDYFKDQIFQLSLSVEQLTRIIQLQQIAINLSKYDLYEAQKTDADGNKAVPVVGDKEYAVHAKIKRDIDSKIKSLEFLELTLSLTNHPLYRFLKVNVLGQKIILPQAGDRDRDAYLTARGKLSIKDQNKFRTIFYKFCNSITDEEEQTTIILASAHNLLSEKPQQTKLLRISNIKAKMPSAFYADSYNRENVNHTSFGQQLEVLGGFMGYFIMPFVVDYLTHVGIVINSILYGSLYTVTGAVVKAGVNVLSKCGLQLEILDEINVWADKVLADGAKMDGTLAFIYKLLSGNFNINKLKEDINNNAISKIIKVVPRSWLPAIFISTNSLLTRMVPAKLATSRTFAALAVAASFMPAGITGDLISVASEGLACMGLYLCAAVCNLVGGDVNAAQQNILDCADEGAKRLQEIIQMPSKVLEAPSLLFSSRPTTSYEIEELNGMHESFKDILGYNESNTAEVSNGFKVPRGNG